MITIGVDIAKGETTTALCTIRWAPGVATVSVPVVGASDAVVLASATAPEVSVVALDAPFGWPAAMVSAVTSWRPGGRWASPTDVAFRLRRTDVVTATKTRAGVDARRAAGAKGLRPAVPLSVSADKIAMAAWRCCALLDALANGGAEVVTDALGTVFPGDEKRRVVEAYPAAALAMWGIPREGYKAVGAEALTVREAILSAIERAGEGGWLRWEPHARETCAATDHALDAFVCALVARAAVLGLLDPVPSDDAVAARAEGWIALPHSGALRSLALGVDPLARPVPR